MLFNNHTSMEKLVRLKNLTAVTQNMNTRCKFIYSCLIMKTRWNQLIFSRIQWTGFTKIAKGAAHQNKQKNNYFRYWAYKVSIKCSYDSQNTNTFLFKLWKLINTFTSPLMILFISKSWFSSSNTKTQRQTHIHMRMCTQKNMYAKACTNRQIYSHTHAHTHKHTHSHTHTHKDTHRHPRLDCSIFRQNDWIW